MQRGCEIGAGKAGFKEMQLNQLRNTGLEA